MQGWKSCRGSWKRDGIKRLQSVPEEPGTSGHSRHDHLNKYAYFDKMLFRTVCFYQWSWKLNYKCSLMALAIWVHFRSSNFRHVTDNWELTVKIFTLKWGKDNERATSSFRYISEAIKKVLINSPCMCVYVI